MLKKVLFLSLFLMATPALAANFSGPDFAPPTCPDNTRGCDIPLNVSSSGQTKLGALITGGLRSMTDLIVDGSNGFVSILLNNNKAIGWKTNTGVPASLIFFGGDNSLRFKTGYGGGGLRVYDGTGGVELARFIDNGNVGFGTAAPASRVDVVGDICWTPPGNTRRCLGTFDPAGGGGGGGSTPSYWNQTAAGDLRNTNTTGQVNIQGQIKIEQGGPDNNKILISTNNAGLARWASASEIPGVTGLGNDVLHTEFGGCVPAAGCPLKTGDTAPSQRVALLGGGVGSVIMSCPAGYKVVSGGAECDRSFQAGLYAGTLSFLTASRPISETEWEVQCTKYFLSNWSFAQIIINSAEAIRRANITCAK